MRQRQSKKASNKPELSLLRVFIVVLLLLGCAVSTPALADAANRQQAIDMAMRQNGGDGKVLGVKTETSSNGQTVFAVKIISNGRVRIFRIPKAR